MRILLILIFLIGCVTPPPTIDDHYLGGPEDPITTLDDENTPDDDGLLDWIRNWLHGQPDEFLVACGWRWSWWAGCKRQADRRCPDGYTEIKRLPSNRPLSEAYILNGMRPPYMQNMMVVKCK